MQMVVHDREPRTVDREDLHQLLEPLLDPSLSPLEPRSTQERPPHTAREAVVPGGDTLINDHRAGSGHRVAPSDREICTAAYTKQCPFVHCQEPNLRDSSRSPRPATLGTL